PVLAPEAPTTTFLSFEKAVESRGYLQGFSCKVRIFLIIFLQI
ncbi:unnamed protein product, partial [marine sediment metagenome]